MNRKIPIPVAGTKLLFEGLFDIILIS